LKIIASWNASASDKLVAENTASLYLNRYSSNLLSIRKGTTLLLKYGHRIAGVRPPHDQHSSHCQKANNRTTLRRHGLTSRPRKQITTPHTTNHESRVTKTAPSRWSYTRSLDFLQQRLPPRPAAYQRYSKKLQSSINNNNLLRRLPARKQRTQRPNAETMQEQQVQAQQQDMAPRISPRHRSVREPGV